MELGVDVDSKYWIFDKPTYDHVEQNPEVEPLADWMEFFIPENQVNALRASDINRLEFNQDVDFAKATPLISKCENIKEVVFSNLVSRKSFRDSAEAISSCGANKVRIGGIKGRGDFDIAWLASMDSLEMLTVYDVKDSVSQISNFGPSNLKGLYLVEFLLKAPNDWDPFFKSECVRNLERLHISAGMDLDSAKRIGELSSLKVLTLREASIPQLDFLLKLKKLESLSLFFPPINDAEIAKLESMTQLKHLVIRNNESISRKAVMKLKKALPNCEFFDVDFGSE